jgi:hypothetical protein
MATRGWGVSIATAVGVAAGASAAQLGLGYGLGIITWIPASAPDGESAWVASLAWATWIAATSVVAGAYCADRLAGSPGPEVTTGGPGREGGGEVIAGDAGPGTFATALWRLALAMAAAIGGALTVALVAVPARAAERADSFAPQTIAAGYAVVGVIAGLAVAFGALSSAAVAANVIITVSWLWLLAVVAVVHGVLVGRGLSSAQLGVWDFTSDGPWLRNLYVPGMLLSLVAALVIGVVAALPAARREDSRVGVAVSGAVGPLLVAAAYFLATPRLTGARAEQFSAYLIAPYAVIAGLAGSVLVSALGPPGRPQPGGAGGGQAPPVADGYPPQLPAGPAERPDEQPEAARGRASVD